MSNRKSKQRRRKRAAQRRRRRVLKREGAAQFIKTVNVLCEGAPPSMPMQSPYAWPWPAHQLACAITALKLELRDCTTEVLTAVFAIREEFKLRNRSELPHWLRTLMNKIKVPETAMQRGARYHREIETGRS